MIALLAALLCVAANAFFVAAEFAFAKVRPTSLEALARAGDPRAERALRMTKQLDAYLSATQLGITLASLGLGWLGQPAVADLVRVPLEAVGASGQIVDAVSYAVAFSVISFLHIVVGELVPKSVAIQRPEQVTRWSGFLLRSFFLITWPAMWALNGLSNLTLRAIGLPAPQHAEGKLSAEEIRIIIEASFGDQGARDRKRDLLERVLRGTDRPARAIMVPRVDMQVLAPDSSIEECLKVARKQGYSRYPLCESGDPDRVIGYLHVKDLLSVLENPSLSIASLKRDILFVPETTKVGDLLSEFQLTSIPIAIVVDEYGGTEGLVTVEDVVEEMVGEIQDEHDVEGPRVLTRDDGTMLVDGSLPVHELTIDGLDFGDEEVSDTIGGYVVSKLGRLARRGDRARAGGFDIVVEEVRRRRVARVVLIRRPESIPPAEPEAAPEE